MVARPDAPLQNLNNTVPFACDRSDSTRGAIVEREGEGVIRSVFGRANEEEFVVTNWELEGAEGLG